MDVWPKAIKQTLLAGVADRIACRIRAQDEIQPNGRAPGAGVLDGDVIDRATLETEELLVGGARRCGNEPQAQSGASSGATSVAADHLEGFGGPTSPAVRWPLPRAHAAILILGICSKSSDPRDPGGRVTLVQPTDQATAGTTARARARRPGVVWSSTGTA